jgi:hypothetical protein
MQIFSSELFKRGLHANADEAGSAPRRGVAPSLTSALHKERSGLEAQLNQSDCAPTETLRLALRRYRALSRKTWLYSD